MADGDVRVVRLTDDYYRDGFYKIIAALLMIAAAVLLMVAISFYLVSQRPSPVYFHTDSEWRAFAPVPVDQPYLQQADLAQWVSDVLPSAFTLDFLHYKDEQNALTQYFTDNGFKKLTDLQDRFLNEQMIERGRIYAQTKPAGAPVVLNQGLLSGKYGWWIQMPLTITLTGVDRNDTRSLVVQALVIRIPTLNDLWGVTIDDLIVAKTTEQGAT